jgi:hypothetical protein
MNSAVAALERVQKTADAKKRAAPIRVGVLAPGDEVRQGDVYFVALNRVPANAAVIAKPEPQLAPGTTQGSRHIVTAESMANCRFHVQNRATVLDGPVIEVLRAPVEVSHPEHGHVVFDQPGVYAVAYQRQFAEELKRVQD